MSDSEEEPFCNYYGTPLQPYDEDAFPKKRPITVEEQVAKDAQGRRRFHGAFTGGFSAGFFNTVGSLEGWTPSEFRSSRNDKAKNVAQAPTDFMDDEDVGEFGIAPQIIQATKDYTSSNKRKKEIFSSGPIPGQPVLQSLIESSTETIGYYILKNMTIKQKKQMRQELEESKSQTRVYGCEMPKDVENIEGVFKETYNLPDIYKHYLQNSKSNSAGLGHSGLNDSRSISGSSQSHLSMTDKNNKKISISGQAFGVGAFEEEDEDIYSKDDMTKYDFELTNEKHEIKTVRQSLGDFVLSNTPLVFKNNFPPPIIPSSFTGKHNVKRSRFEPLPEDKIKEKQYLPKRKDINASVRAKYLGDSSDNRDEHNDVSSSSRSSEPSSIDVKDESEVSKSDFKMSNLLFDKFVTASQSDEHVTSKESTEILHGNKEMHDAVRLKMFGPLTRITSTWQPCSLLCKRFNVPEPQFRDDNSAQSTKRKKHLIFEYQKHAEQLPTMSGISSSSTFHEKIVVKQEISEKIEEEIPVKSTEEDPVNVETSADNEEKDVNNSLPLIKNYNEKIDVSKQVDLFKAVFLSSSESESEDDEAEKQNRLKEVRESILSESLLPKIKPTTKGILSDIDFSSLNNDNKIVENNTEEKDKNEQKDDNVTTSHESFKSDDNNSYGPQLPNKKADFKSHTYSRATAIDDDSDEWVEKQDKPKKHKKHKKKHKKEKSKGKREHKSKY
ncbi:G patch domain-containing protein 1 [Agrilus planipennis]|uniref:G patch domain-containing protein 1 n=1 Tax=Agrilus planipennis TaxID=224129 RepID=A0A1W4XMV8_AGRPL|nr:G patch domain-containing protein 1 [Agrilus planipennis]